MCVGYDFQWPTAPENNCHLLPSVSRYNPTRQHETYHLRHWQSVITQRRQNLLVILSVEIANQNDVKILQKSSCSKSSLLEGCFSVSAGWGHKTQYYRKGSNFHLFPYNHFSGVLSIDYPDINEVISFHGIFVRKINYCEFRSKWTEICVVIAVHVFDIQIRLLRQ